MRNPSRMMRMLEQLEKQIADIKAQLADGDIEELERKASPLRKIAAERSRWTRRPGAYVAGKTRMFGRV